MCPNRMESCNQSNCAHWRKIDRSANSSIPICSVEPKNPRRIQKSFSWMWSAAESAAHLWVCDNAASLTSMRMSLVRSSVVVSPTTRGLKSVTENIGPWPSKATPIFRTALLTSAPFRFTLNEDMHRKMIQPLSESLGDSAQARFKRFAKAILAVPKSEITPPEEALAKLEAQKQRIDAKLSDVRRELAKRKATKAKPPK